jgi:hypothetical protein
VKYSGYIDFFLDRRNFLLSMQVAVARAIRLSISYLLPANIAERLITAWRLC